MSHLVPAWPTQAQPVPNPSNHPSKILVGRQPLRTRPGRPPLTPLPLHLGALPGPAAFIPPANMAEVLQRLATLTTMPLRKQRDTMTAVRAVGRILGRPLHEITTDPASFARC